MRGPFFVGSNGTDSRRSLGLRSARCDEFARDRARLRRPTIIGLAADWSRLTKRDAMNQPVRESELSRWKRAARRPVLAAVLAFDAGITARRARFQLWRVAETRLMVAALAVPSPARDIAAAHDQGECEQRDRATPNRNRHGWLSVEMPSCRAFESAGHREFPQLPVCIGYREMPTCEMLGGVVGSRGSA